MTNVQKKSTRVACAPAAAYDAFTQAIDLWWPPEHRKFEGSTLRLDAHVGGRFFEAHADHGEFTLGDVIAADPPHALRFTWHPGKLTAPTTVDIRFTPDGEGTLVEVEHIEGAAAMGARWPERAAMFNTGWTRVLAALTDHIDRS